MIFDFHIHSRYSPDSLSRPRDIVRFAKRRGLNGIAITDHNTIKGGIEARRINQDENFIVIVGCEIGTEIGDIVGLFLEKEIRSRNSLEVIDEIHEQGGIAVLPHPYRNKKLRVTGEVLQEIDVIEVFNSRRTEEDNRKSLELAESLKKPIIAGSDAHFLTEVGRSSIIVSSEDVKSDILAGRVKLMTAPTSRYLPLLSGLVMLTRKYQFHKIPKGLLGFIKVFFVVLF